MNNASTMTTIETARAIMGPNLIDIKEASIFFPLRPDNLCRYDKILFSEALLYHCSEESNPYILVPGIHYNRSVTRPLTIWEMKNSFADLFAPCEPLDNPTISFVNDSTPLPRWYLLPKRAVDLETIDRLFETMEIAQCHGKKDPDSKPWEIEDAVVYIYAWILFFLIRKERIFPEVPINTENIYSSKHRTKVCLRFKNGKIIIGPKPINGVIGIVPSIKLNLK